METQDLTVWREYLPNLQNIMAFSEKIVQAVIILVIGQFLIFLLKYISKRKILQNKNARNERVNKTISTLISNLMRYVIYFFVVFQILSIFGVSISSLVAVAGVGSVAIGFGAQSLVKDVLAGVFIIADDQYAVGDYITVGNLSGTVEAVGIRTTRLRSFTGELHIIPNGEIATVTNLSNGFLRAMVLVPLPYEANTDRVIEIMRDEVSKFQSDVIMSPPLVQGITEFGENSYTIRVVCECKIGESWGVERELRRLIKNRLEAEGIPYPRRVVEVFSKNP